MTAYPDDLADLLGPTPPPSSHARTKAAVIRATTRRLTWDRRLRRARTAGAVAAVFAAGGMAGWFGKPDPVPPAAPEPAVYPVPVVVLRPATDPPPPPPSPAEYVSAEGYEIRAEQAIEPAESARLYRLAGGQYEARAEYGQASRCYRLYLLAVGPDGRAVATDDSWLLMSVKTSQPKEADRDPKQGS